MRNCPGSVCVCVWEGGLCFPEGGPEGRESGGCCLACAKQLGFVVSRWPVGRQRTFSGDPTWSRLWFRTIVVGSREPPRTVRGYGWRDQIVRTGTFLAPWPVHHLGAVGLRHEGKRSRKRKRFQDWQPEKVTLLRRGFWSQRSPYGPRRDSPSPGPCPTRS